MENENETELETITYQGREIEAELMGEIDGQHMWGRRDAVNVGLYRDGQGIYYLQRESHNSQDGRVTSPLFASERAAEYDYRCIVHRIGINAAILWAVGQLGNGDPWNLRLDAGNAIMVDKGYNDPNPVYSRYIEHKQAAASDGSVAREGLGHALPVSFGDAPLRVTLDANASALVRRYLEVTPWDYTVEDIVSGAIANALGIAFSDLENTRNHFLSSRDSDFADDGWGYVEQEIYDARQRRTGELEYDDQEADGSEIPRTPKPGHAYPDNPAGASLLADSGKEAA